MRKLHSDVHTGYANSLYFKWNIAPYLETFCHW
jgi:hypothetical protein